MRAGIRTALALAVVLALALTASGPAAQAVPDRTPRLQQQPAAIGPTGLVPTVTPPTELDARVREDGRLVSIRSRVGLRATVSDERLPDRVTVQVSIRDPRTGRLQHEAARVMAVDPATGVVRGEVRLSPVQHTVLARAAADSGGPAAARLVRVRLVQAADVSAEWPGREALAVVERAARWGGRAPGVPARQLRSSGETVTVQNSTSSPLTVLAGPVQCIYDNAYASTQKTNQQSFLGSMNGALLMPGTSLSVAITKDDNDLDGYYNDFNYQGVLADYQQAVQDGFVWAQQMGITSLPGMGFPYTQDNPMGLTYQLWQTVGLFVGHSILDLVGAAGAWRASVTALADRYPEYAEQIERYANALEPFVDGALDIFEAFLAIVQGLITLVQNGCSGNPGYFILGATDMYHPWRSFAQVYNWNDGSVDVAYDKQAQTSYVALANGMITQYLAPDPEDVQDVTDNDLESVFLPGGAKGAPVFVFRQPPNQAQAPAVATLQPGTRTVACALDPADETALSENLSRQMGQVGTQDYLMSYPAPLWGDITTGAIGAVQPTSPGYPFDYFVGYQYTAPAVASTLGTSTARVYWSSDGVSFESYVDIPPGQSSVTLPAESAGQAALVTCVIQAAEMWNVGQSPLPTERGLIMGTLVPSDVIQGPDYPAAG